MSTEDTVANLNAAHFLAQQQQNVGPRPSRKAVDMNTGTAINTPTPSLDPRIVSNIDGWGATTTGPYVAPAFEAFELCHKNIQAVIDLRHALDQDPSMTPEGRLLDLAEHVEKKQEQATKAFDSARARLVQGVTALEDSLNKPLTDDNRVGGINTEIRNHLKALSPEERHGLLDKALKDGDHTTLRAALSGPGFLIGITEEQRKLRINMFWRSTQPDIAQRADVMRKGIELIESRAGLAFDQFEKAMGGTGSWVKVAKLRERRKAVTAARGAA